MPHTKAHPRCQELIALRLNLGMTQEELGHALELGGKYPGHSIHRYERGRVKVPPRVLKAARMLAAILQEECDV